MYRTPLSFKANGAHGVTRATRKRTAFPVGRAVLCTPFRAVHGSHGSASPTLVGWKCAHRLEAQLLPPESKACVDETQSVQVKTSRPSKTQRKAGPLVVAPAGDARRQPQRGFSGQKKSGRSKPELQRSNELLERRVRERTRELRMTNAQLESEIQRRKGLEGEILSVSDREQQRLGQELHDGLCQH